MIPSLDEWLNKSAPKPSAKAKDEAWEVAALEFHRAQHQSKDNSLRVWKRMGVGSGVAAVVAIGAIILIDEPAPPVIGQNNGSSPSWQESRPDMVSLFQEGRKLFGTKLSAVTIRENNVIWHISESELLPHQSPNQLLVFTLLDSDRNGYAIATAPGFPLHLQLNGSRQTVDFVSDVGNHIIGSGNGVFLFSNDSSSMIKQAEIHDLGKEIL